MADLYKINIEAGTDYEVTFNQKNADGDPIDLTNFTARMQFRRTVDATGTPDKEMTTSSGHLVITALLGIITLTIPNAETAVLSGIYLDSDILIIAFAGSLIDLP